MNKIFEELPSLIKKGTINMENGTEEIGLASMSDIPQDKRMILEIVAPIRYRFVNSICQVRVIDWAEPKMEELAVGAAIYGSTTFLSSGLRRSSYGCAKRSMKINGITKVAEILNISPLAVINAFEEIAGEVKSSAEDVEAAFPYLLHKSEVPLGAEAVRTRKYQNVEDYVRPLKEDFELTPAMTIEAAGTVMIFCSNHHLGGAEPVGYLSKCLVSNYPTIANKVSNKTLVSELWLVLHWVDTIQMMIALGIIEVDGVVPLRLANDFILRLQAYPAGCAIIGVMKAIIEIAAKTPYWNLLFDNEKWYDQIEYIYAVSDDIFKSPLEYHVGHLYYGYEGKTAIASVHLATRLATFIRFFMPNHSLAKSQSLKKYTSDPILTDLLNAFKLPKVDEYQPSKPLSDIAAAYSSFVKEDTSAALAANATELKKTTQPPSAPAVDEGSAAAAVPGIQVSKKKKKKKATQKEREIPVFVAEDDKEKEKKVELSVEEKKLKEAQVTIEITEAQDRVKNEIEATDLEIRELYTTIMRKVEEWKALDAKEKHMVQQEDFVKGDAFDNNRKAMESLSNEISTDNAAYARLQQHLKELKDEQQALTDKLAIELAKLK